MNKSFIIQKLKELKPQLCSEYPITFLGIFGSLVRNETQSNSDVDILVDFDFDKDPLNMSRYLSLIDCLEKNLGQKVDLVTRQGLHPLLKDKILAEVEEINF